MKKWNLVVDVAACNGCHNCFLAVKDEHVENDFPGYCAPQPRHGHRWIEIRRRERGRAPMLDVAYLPVTCNHCDEAPCVRAGPEGAVYQRRDGIVIIDPVKARGRREIVDSCPYGAIWWNEALELPQKWIFDAHLIDRGWREPRCAKVCPTGAMRALYVEDSEMRQIARREGLEVLHPEWGTKPRVYYRNLYRYTKCFVGAAVAVRAGGVEECVPGALAVLEKDGARLAEQRTDAFGEFRFDGLEPESGLYRIALSHPRYGAAALKARLGESQCLGTVYLA